MIQRLLALLRELSHDVVRVKSIHAKIIFEGLSMHQPLARRLVRVYSDLGILQYARDVFDEFSHPQLPLFNAMIRGYVRNDLFDEVLNLFKLMRSRCLEVDSYACNFALKACTLLSDYETGIDIVKFCLERNLQNEFLGSSMITFLLNFGHLKEAREIFYSMPDKDVVCWNAMISGFVRACKYKEACALFVEMQRCGVMPSPVTVACLVQLSEGIKSLRVGKCVHGFTFGQQVDGDVLVLTSLLTMYSMLGDLVSARRVFNSIPLKNLVSWNAMISGYVQNGLIREAFALFRELDKDSLSCFDSGTIVSLLQACVLEVDLEGGKVIHGYMYRMGYQLNIILSTALLDLYIKCNALELALRVFDGMQDRNVISWTAILVGLSQNGRAEDAVKLFHQMQAQGVVANSTTLVSLIHACTHFGSPRKGMSVHGHILRRNIGLCPVNVTALIDMYAKCGKVDYADRVHRLCLIQKDVILWNSLIAGFGMHGFGYRALATYHSMIIEGIKPNESTFISILMACNYSGLVKEGTEVFYNMEKDHNIRPTQKLYACFVDLLSRAGHLGEAEDLIKKMPFEPASCVFEALLNGCNVHKNVALGVRIAGMLLQLDISNPGIYVMLSNIYAQARNWAQVEYVRGLMRQRGLKKTPGYSLVEIGGGIHTFYAGDYSHPRWTDIKEMLDTLRLGVGALGYEAGTMCVLRNVDEPMMVKLLLGY